MTVTLVTSAGAGRHASDLADALERSDEVSLERVQAPIVPGSRPLARGVSGILREALYYPVGLGRVARRRGADLVHCPAPFAPRNLGLPLVLTIHDLLPWRFPDLFTRGNVLHYKLFALPAAKRAQRVLCGSEFTRDELIEVTGIPEERIAITPSGIDRRFRPVEVDRDRLRSRFGIDRPYVLCVGTQEPRKNLVTLLEAFERFRRVEDGFLLVSVGGRGWRDERIQRQLARASEWALQLGFVSDDDLIELYSGASCFAFPSLYEGFGFPPLEAMACGCPVIASNRTSIPEVVGDAGILVHPEDVAALAAALDDVLLSESRATDLRERGLARAAQYRWETCARQTVAAYREALSEA